MSQLADDHWTRYWAHGFLHSCPNAFAGNYEDAIRSFWVRFFEDLADGAAVLDIGTGNGAVALFARDVARSSGRTFKIIGADRARIDPPAAARDRTIDYSGIEFRSGVAAEATGFSDAHFDAITSHYVLEYTQVDTAVRELARLLAPGGRLGCVIHHIDSIVTATAREEVGHIRFLMDDVRIFERTIDVLHSAADATTPSQLAALAEDKVAEELRTGFNAASARVTQRIRESRHVDLLQLTLGQISKALRDRPSLGYRKAIQDLDIARRELLASERRLLDLLDAAMSRQTLEVLQRQLVEAGLSLTRIAELHHTDRKLLGWSLVAVRNSDE